MRYCHPCFLSREYVLSTILRDYWHEIREDRYSIDMPAGKIEREREGEREGEIKKCLFTFNMQCEIPSFSPLSLFSLSLPKTANPRVKVFSKKYFCKTVAGCLCLYV